MELFRRIGIVLPIGSAFLFILAYIYNKIYYSNYGIHVSQYFTVSDYLSSTIDKIDVAIISGLIAILIDLIVFYFFPRQILSKNINKMPKQDRIILVYIFFSYIIFLFLTFVIFVIAIPIASYFQNKYNFISSLYVAGMIASIIVSMEISKKYNNEKSNITFILILFSFIFPIAMCKELSHNIVLINGYAKPECDRIELASPVSDELDTCELIWLGANSGYAFFRYEKTGESVVLSRSNIVYRRVERRSWPERLISFFYMDSGPSQPST